MPFFFLIPEKRCMSGLEKRRYKLHADDEVHAKVVVVPSRFGGLGYVSFALATAALLVGIVALVFATATANPTLLLPLPHLIDAFAATITHKDISGNLELFAPNATIDFHRLMTFLIPPNILTADTSNGNWGQQLDVFFAEFITNHMTLTNCNITLPTVTCIGYYTYTYDFGPTALNLPSVVSSFSARFHLDQNYKLTHAEALPNATSTFIWYSSSGVESPGPILVRKRSLSSNTLAWNTLQSQINSLLARGQTQQALSICNTTQYLTLKATFDPLSVNTSLPCNTLVQPTTLTVPMVCSAGGGIDASCLLNANLTLNSLTVTSMTVQNVTQSDISRQNVFEVDNLIVNGSVTCVSPTVISAACLPDRVAKINMIAPQPTTLDFTIVGGPGISVTGSASSLTISNNINITLAGPVFIVRNMFGMLTITPQNQTARTFFAGPQNGTGMVPTFRFIAHSDLPLLNLYDPTMSFIGVLPQSHGGTGLAGGPLVINGNGTIAVAHPNGTYSIDWTHQAVVSVGINVPGSIFTVTSSIVTSTGNHSFVLNLQAANSVLCGPSIAGPDAVPTFRLLAEADIPLLNASSALYGIVPITRGGTGTGSTLTGSKIIVSSASGTSLVEGNLAAGQGLTLTLVSDTLTVATTALLNASLSVPTDIFVLTVPTITGPSSGTLTFTKAEQLANTVWAGPSSGADAVPTFRTITQQDLPSAQTLTSLSVTGSTFLGSNTSCIAPLLPSCYDISSQVCAQGPLSSNCMPSSIHFTTLTVDYLMVLNGSQINMDYANYSYLGSVLIDGPLTCSGNGTVSNDCLQLGNYTCPMGMPLAESCIPASLVMYDLSVVNNLTINQITCAGPVLPNSCLPDRIKSINGIMSSALDFVISASTGISITPAANGIVIENTGVTSVGLTVPTAEFAVTSSPVMANGTMVLTKQNQTARTVWAGPLINSPSEQPTFRILETSDLPSLGITGTGGITIVNGTIITGTGATVSSVGLNLPASIFSVTVSPITTTGDLTATLVTQVQKTFFAGPTSSVNDVPAFRAMQLGDLPALAQGSFYVGTGMGGVIAGTINGYGGVTVTSDAVGTVNITGSGGTLTMVDLSVPSAEFLVSGGPLTGAGGTLTLTKVNQAKNLFWSGPLNGTNAQPVFRTLGLEDLTPLAMTNGQLIIGSTGSAPLVGNLLNGSNIVITNTPGGILISSSINASAIGTVFSVGLSLPGSLFSVSQSPVVTSGTLTGSFVNQSANTVFAGPTSGAASAPTFRLLSIADLPALANNAIYIGQDGNGTMVSTMTAGTGIVLTNTGGVTSLSTNISVGLSIGGSLFTVSGSPVTSTGTLTAALNAQSANLFFAGPTSAAASAPTFRAIELADLPALANGQIYIGSNGVATATSLAAGSGITITPGPGTLTITATSGSGTVTSIGLSLPGILFSVSGSPVTSAGTLTGTLVTQVANVIFAGPTTGVATPTFRFLVAADIPSLDTSKLTTGILPIAQGGTNSGTTLSNGRIMVSSAGSIVEAAALTVGQFLVGSAGAPVATTLMGTTNQVIVTLATGTITLSTPQNIHTDATPTFASEILTATTNQLRLGTTNTVTISSSAPSASRTYTLHDAGANAHFVLDTGGALTITNAASSGQVLTGTSSTTASWQPPAVPNALFYNEVASSVDISGFSSGTYVIVTTMTTILDAGTWHVSFSTIILPTSSSATYEVVMFNGATAISHSLRAASGSSAAYMVHTQGVVVSNGSSQISIQWRKLSGSGSATMYARSMFSVRIA